MPDARAKTPCPAQIHCAVNTKNGKNRAGQTGPTGAVSGANGSGSLFVRSQDHTQEEHRLGTLSETFDQLPSLTGTIVDGDNLRDRDLLGDDPIAAYDALNDIATATGRSAIDPGATFRFQ